MKKRSQKEWKKYWDKTDILISGNDDYDQLAIRYALYHLHIMANRDDDRDGIGAKGLSGDGYGGHNLWDTEIYLMPYYLLTDPEQARNLLVYRGKSLIGARNKAYRNGFRGAMFPWEAAGLADGEVALERGEADLLTGEMRPILNGKREVHVSADVSYAVWCYYKITKDKEFMREWGNEIILATAVFWADRVEWSGDVCHLRNIIGPDQYKERINDNTYTNYMVKHNLQFAVKITEALEKEDPEYLEQLNNRWEIKDMLPLIKKAADGIYLPDMSADDIIPQFEDYKELEYLDISQYKQSGINAEKKLLQDYTIRDLQKLQVHKQADLILLLTLFPNLVDKEKRKEVLERNYEFYEKRTIHAVPHSQTTHSLLAAYLGKLTESYELYRQCCDMALGNNGADCEDGIYAVAMGGIWQCIIQGFCGISIRDGKLCINPRLPEKWDKVQFKLSYSGAVLDISVKQHGAEIINNSHGQVCIIYEEKPLLLDGQQKLNLVKKNNQ